MTVRLTVSLPDDLYAHVIRVAEASRVSASSIVRAAVAELVPRTARMLDFMGTEPSVTPEQAAAVETFGEDLKRFLDLAPEALRPLIEALQDRPDETGA
jgi:metal-responsive CopG/Arc/MetJ family transcriptional regulator